VIKLDGTQAFADFHESPQLAFQLGDAFDRKELAHIATFPILDLAEARMVGIDQDTKDNSVFGYDNRDIRSLGDDIAKHFGANQGN
jgi:hypothetical protein